MTPHPPKLVSAGAGTGKTWRIVQLLLERVRAGTPVDRLAAVTFTEAAAGELLDRLRERLLAEGFDAQAAQAERAAVCTIHRFALMLLQRYPLAAGIAPEPMVLDDRGSKGLLREVLAGVLRVEAEALRSVLENSFGQGVGLSHGYGASSPEGRLRRLVEELLEKARSLAMDPARIEAEGSSAVARLLAALDPPGDAQALEAALSAGIAQGFAWLDTPQKKPFSGDDPLRELLRALRGERCPADLDAALRLHLVKRTGTTEKALAGLFTAVERAVTTHPSMHQRIATGVRTVFTMAARAVDGYAVKKSAIGAVDFEDMQLLALELLRGRGSDAQAYASLVSAGLPYVVIDEFQDTSPLQFQLFEALRNAGSEVTYVGDLKQGIYGFRTADSALFAALLDRPEIPGSPVETLDRSRRSRPELVAFANELFSALLPRHGMRFDALTAENDYSNGRFDASGPTVDVVHHDRPHQHDPKVHAGVRRLKSLVAEGRSVLDRATRLPRPMGWGDIAVLGFDRFVLERWNTALRSEGIATVREADGFFDTLEVGLARQWFAMVASPRDSAAAGQVLLSELYGISLRTVVRLALEKLSGSPWKALAVADENPSALPLSPVERRALARCSSDLEECRRWLRQLPLPEAVERCIERVGLADRLSLRGSEVESAQVRANLGALVAYAHDLAARGYTALGLAGASGATLENLLLAWSEAADVGAKQSLPAITGDAVRLVTLHSSKGMEYPVVLLDVLSRKMEQRLPRVDVLRPEDPEVMLGPTALEHSGVQVVPEVCAGANLDRLRASFDGEANRDAELARLLYVAVTRAREHLVLLWPNSGKATTEILRDMVTAVVNPPPAGTVQGASAEWLGVPVRIFAVESGRDDEAPATTAREDRVSEVSAVPVTPIVATGESALPTLGRCSPSELCQVADCPEVPRIARFAKGERHAMARFDGEVVRVRTIPSARRERYAIPREVSAPRLGQLVHSVVERAVLGPAATDDPVADMALARRVLAAKGQNDHAEALAALAVRTLAGLRASAKHLGATREPYSEVPFVMNLGGTTLHGIIDLLVPAEGGVHVVDLKTHALADTERDRWAAYYRPQLDAYALAAERLTGLRVLGRHLAIPSSGVLVTVEGEFSAQAAEKWLSSLADTLARRPAGPGVGRDCLQCGWSSLCGVGQRATRAAAESRATSPASR